MKWKCNSCWCGPCVYECASYREDAYINPKTEKCPRSFLLPNWKKMSGEEPEQEAKTGLPEWLKVGNFIKLGSCNTVCRIEGYDTEQKILSISRKKYGGEARTVKHDIHCEAGWGEAQIVFPKPYTFETAPIMLKVRRKHGIRVTVLEVCFRPKDSVIGYNSCRYDDKPFISFEKALKDYEQLDGWPCGTFDGETVI